MKAMGMVRASMTGGGGRTAGVAARAAMGETEIRRRSAGLPVGVSWQPPGPINVLLTGGETVFISRGDGYWAQVFTTHNIVYRDARGSTRTARGYCEIDAPYFDKRSGRMTQGRGQICYVQGMVGPIPQADVIAATPIPGVTRLMDADTKLGINPYLASKSTRTSRHSGRPAGYLDPNEGGLYDNEPEAVAGVKGALDKASEKSGQPNPVAGISDESLGRLFGAIGGVINSTITGISNAIVSGNQIEIAHIQAATAQYIANLQAQGRSASQEAQAAAALQASLAANRAYIPPAPPPSEGMSTGTMVAIGLGAVAVIGVGVLLVMKRKGRKNPSGRRRRRAA